MRIVCLSDTHGMHDQIAVPDGDVLLHAGDFTGLGEMREIAAFDAWLGRLPHRHKVVIAGNHDFLFERNLSLARSLLGSATYLQDTACTIDGLRFWGSPWQPRFFDWAFNLDRGEPLRRKWALIPEQVDVLVTHGPPRGVLDRTSSGEQAGCEELAAALARVRPRVHVFGHIHEGYGRMERDGTRFINACNCDLAYRPVQPPLVIDV